jgi:hypothetical protein
MANKYQVFRGLEANRSGQTPLEGELLYTTDTKKLYVGDGSTAGGIAVDTGGSISNGVYAITGAVDFTSATAQSVGTLPANGDVLRTYMIVTTPSDAATTATVGDATNGAAAYMAATENDPENADTFIADNFVSNGGASRTAEVTVATPGSVGAATCVVEYRLT